jgi:hypothetical protein
VISPIFENPLFGVQFQLPKLEFNFQNLKLKQHYLSKRFDFSLLEHSILKIQFFVSSSEQVPGIVACH